MGSVVLEAKNNNNNDHFFNHTTSAEGSPYRESSSSSSSAVAHHGSRPTYHSPYRQHQLVQQHPAPRTPYHSEHPVMSQRVSSGGSSSTSATIGHNNAAPSSRPTSVVNTRAAAAVPPSEPALQASSVPISPHSDRSNAIGNVMNPSSLSSTTTTTIRPAAQPSSRRRVKVRDLQHIQSFATEDMGAFSQLRNRSRSRSRGAGYEDEGTQYEISEMKVEHIIEMVAGLLTKITSTNDQQHEHLHRQPPSIDHASGMSAQTSSVLAFHGKNIPSITILSYLSRINKYCPTSYEVFLSLLVYFDRMTERVNAGPIQGLRQMSERNLDRHNNNNNNNNQQQHLRSSGSASSSSSSSLSSDKMEEIIHHGLATDQAGGTQTATPPASGSMEKATEQNIPGTPYSRPRGIESPSIPSEPRSPDLYNLSHFFVVDSFNIHRLVIAGVTCASKFFSDIFYTNSRYAKVGGLPLPELNHLELQFLLLNDFRLSIPVEEIEAYGTMLVEFYAREVVAQQRAADELVQMRSSSESSADSAMTVQAAG